MGKKKIFVQLWDCPNCGRKRLSALTDKECPDCAQVLSDDFLTNLNYREEREIDPADPFYARALEGADWLCPVCGKRNPATIENCSCGTHRGDLEAAQGAVDQNGTTTGGIKDWMKDNSQLEATKRRASGEQAKKKLTVQTWAIAGAVLLVGVLLFLLFYKQDLQLTLQSLSWQRTAEVQTYTRQTKTDWEMSLPGDARILSQSREIYEYEQVKIGERTEMQTVTKTRRIQEGTETQTRMERRGNGTLEEVTTQVPKYREETYTVEEPRVVPVYTQRPVYRTKYTYTIDRWVPERTLTESGQDQNPRWPQGLPAAVSQPRLGDQKLVPQKEIYRGYFKDAGGKDHTLELPFDRWQGLKVGTTYPGTQGLVGGAHLK